MSNTLLIFFKATGEHFDIPYRLQTTVHDLINYACTQSTALSNTNPDDYYMVMNKKDMLNNNETVEEIGLNQPNRLVSLDICIRTEVLMKRIIQSRREFWSVPSTQISPKVQQTITNEKSNNSDRTSSSATQQQMDTDTTKISNKNDNNDEVHILVCGGPKVGKSTLINALCGCPVAKTKTIGLDRCTQQTSYYQLDNIYFWDTPGIQEWSHIDIEAYVNLATRNQTPLCMFYCASPGSFVKLKQLDLLLNECICQRHIFCVLVVTNMFAHVNRRAILDEFKTLLSKYIGDSHQIKEENGIWFYGQIGLCTMVNSQEYFDEDTNRLQPQKGINELVLAVTKSLSKTHQLVGWLQTIKNNQQFWIEQQKELYKFTEKPDELCLTDVIELISAKK